MFGVVAIKKILVPNLLIYIHLHEFFSIAMGANYSFDLISIETFTPQVFGRNNLFLGTVLSWEQLRNKQIMCQK